MSAINLMFQFPGVGSQHSGMCREWFDRESLVREVFDEASSALERDMPALCFDASQSDVLNRLECSQAALVCASVALHRVLSRELDGSAAHYLGYSLGEYSALCCSGALSLQDTLTLVWERGLLLRKVATGMSGSMMWIINLSAEHLGHICQEVRTRGQMAWISAYDAPEKSSVSGELAALHEIGERVVKAGGIPIPVPMSGPFHSPMMQEAADGMRKLLRNLAITLPANPVISNLLARPYSSADEIRESLSETLVRPIHWSASLRYARQHGARVGVEVGPKEVLKYALGKNFQDFPAYAIGTVSGFEELRAGLALERRSSCLDLISRCLRAIVTVRNENADLADYRHRTVRAYRRLDALYESVASGETEPTSQLREEAVALTSRALQGKRVPESELPMRLARLVHSGSPAGAH